MALRLALPERPLSSLARGAARLALLGASVALTGVVLARFAFVPPLEGLVVALVGALLALVALVLAGAAGVEIWGRGTRGFGLLMRALVVAGAVLAYPASMAFQALNLPAIGDISTDLVDPPDFSRSRAALAARGGEAPALPSPAVRAVQARDYPRVKSLVVEGEAAEVYEAALEVAKEQGWEIIDRTPPGGPRGQARFDAIARSPLFRFPDDITVRIRPLDQQTRIDIRAAARIGRHDFGANATRIREFLEELRLAILSP